MIGWLLQDWVTIRATNAPVTSIAQGADAWLDIGDYEDLAFFLDVREVTNASTRLVYETSPTKQEQSFAAMVGAFAPAVGQRVDRAFSSLGAIPPARFVRWRLSLAAGGSGNWDVTFRVWVAAYAWVKG